MCHKNTTACDIIQAVHIQLYRYFKIRSNVRLSFAYGESSPRLAAFRFCSGSPLAALLLTVVPQPESPTTSGSVSVLSGRSLAWQHTPSVSDGGSNQSTPSGPHRRQLDSLPPDAL